MNKEKGVLSALENTEDDCDFYQEELPHSSFRAASIDKSESIMKIQELALKIAQLEILVKENTNTMIEGFNHLFTFMNEFL